MSWPGFTGSDADLLEVRIIRATGRVSFCVGPSEEIERELVSLVSFIVLIDPRNKNVRLFWRVTGRTERRFGPGLWQADAETGYTSMLQPSDAEAPALRQWAIAHYSSPTPWVRQIKLDSTANPSSLPQMLGWKLLDRVTISWQPIDGTTSPFTQDSLLESIQHDFTPALRTTTRGHSDAETQTSVTLNDATRGTLVA